MSLGNTPRFSSGGGSIHKSGSIEKSGHDVASEASISYHSQPSHSHTFAATRTLNTDASKTSSRSVRVVLKDVEKVKSFGINRHLLRSTPFHEVLHTWGKVLQHSEGSSETYELSQPCDRIDDFLSHNWSTPRIKKFMAWAMYCNFWTSCFVALLTLATTTALTICEKLVVVETAWGDAGVFGWVLTLPTFVFVVAVRHEVLRCLGLKGHTCFLDKTCIHQTQEVLKQQGIDKLGAFMNKSERMVICYTDIYLNKLWTVYEVACFLMLCPTKSIIVIPTGMIRVVLLCTVFFYVGIGVEKLSNIEEMKFAGYTLAFPPIVCVLELWNQQQHRIGLRVSNFTIADTMCYCEADRPLILANIIALVKFKKLVDVEATPKEALDAFDNLVRNFISKALLRHLGKWGMPYRFLCLVVFLTDFPASADIWAGQFHDLTPRERILNMIASIAFRATTWPLTAAMLIWLLRQCMGLSTRIFRWTYVVLIGALVYAWLVLYFVYVHSLLLEESYRSDVFLSVFVIVYVGQVALTCIVFWHHLHAFTEKDRLMLRHSLANRASAVSSFRSSCTTVGSRTSLSGESAAMQRISHASKTEGLDNVPEQSAQLHQFPSMLAAVTEDYPSADTLDLDGACYLEWDGVEFVEVCRI